MFFLGFPSKSSHPRGVKTTSCNSFRGSSWCPCQPSGILGVTHGAILNLQVLWGLLMVSLPVFRYFGRRYFCQSSGILGFTHGFFATVFRYFERRCSCQFSSILGVTQGALASLQMFLRFCKVLLPAFRYFESYAWFPCQPRGRGILGFLKVLLAILMCP